LIAALTETGIYLWFKGSAKLEAKAEAKVEAKLEAKEGFTEPPTEIDAQPWTKMIQLYGSSGLLWALVAVVLGVAGFLAKDTFRISLGGLSIIALFNALVGFTGYALRFYLIPRVSTVVFSVLSFFGVISAYGLGWLFQNEVPNMTQLMGAVAIIVANGVLMTKETV
jgi:drug/metabolite transporter (DMT)-like permease